MKRLTLASLALLGLALLAPPAEAHGLRRHHGCDSGCGGYAGSGYGDMGPCMNVVWEEREVTVWHAETRTRNVEREVRRLVSREVEVPYTWYEYVTVTTPEKRTVTWCETVTREVPYTYWVNVPVVTPTKKTVMTCKTVTTEVPYTYWVNVPVVTPQRRMVTTWTCVPDKVTCEVPVCLTVPCVECDPCTGCCHTVCRKVMTTQTVTKTVMRSVPVQQEVTVNVCTYKPEERHGVRLECRTIEVPQDVVVNVCTYKSEQRHGVRLECQNVMRSKDVEVNVVSCKRVERHGVRREMVCEWKTERAPVVETYCEMVPHKTKVRVAVPAPCVACAPCCP